jgi:hypothetical protein
MGQRRLSLPRRGVARLLDDRAVDEFEPEYIEDQGVRCGWLECTSSRTQQV